eukprot:GHVP01010837.1.p1 GENE.GHVP01010837.1~~GHVP01010837.1.p1  ORF type:complete len:435 (-),score=79.85 GHVP01010837.1:1313-2617(-)
MSRNSSNEQSESQPSTIVERALLPSIPGASCADVSFDAEYVAVGTSRGEVLIFKRRPGDKKGYETRSLVDHSCGRLNWDEVGWISWMKKDVLAVVSKSDPFLCFYSLDASQEEVMDDIVVDESNHASSVTLIDTTKLYTFSNVLSGPKYERKRPLVSLPSEIQKAIDDRLWLSFSDKWRRDVVDLSVDKSWAPLLWCDAGIEEGETAAKMFFCGEAEGVQGLVVTTSDDVWSVADLTGKKLPDLKHFVWKEFSSSVGYGLSKDNRVLEIHVEMTKGEEEVPRAQISFVELFNLSTCESRKNGQIRVSKIQPNGAGTKFIVFTASGAHCVHDNSGGRTFITCSLIEHTGPGHPFGGFLSSNKLLLLGASKYLLSWECEQFIGNLPDWANDDSTVASQKEAETKKIISFNSTCKGSKNSNFVSIRKCGEVSVWATS